MRRTVASLVAVILVGGLATVALGDIVVLDLVLDQGAKTWQVLGSIVGEGGGVPTSQGLSAFTFDVTGAGGAAVVTSTNQSPRTKSGKFFTGGFVELRSGGTAGVGIRAAQGTVYGTDPNEYQDSLVIQGVGIVAGSWTDGDGGTCSWAYPALLASGTFSGTAGKLSVGGVTGGFLMLKGASPWHGPGNEMRPSAIQGDTEAIGVQNNPPVADADGPYTEGMWMGPGNWCNPARWITLDGSGSYDPDLGQTITYLWDFGGGLTKTGVAPTVTVGELLAAGWPLPPIGNGYYGNISLTVTDNGVPQFSDTDIGQLFLPEPGTMGLLAAGVLGVLLRRRRS